ncbi:hypothetical protein AAY473_038512 [Plecturocebus cupreus]
MDKPRPGKTTFVIMVSSLPGKYDFTRLHPDTAAHASPFTRTVTRRGPRTPRPPRPDTQLDPRVRPAVLDSLPRGDLLGREAAGGEPAAPALHHLHRSRPPRDVTGSTSQSPPAPSRHTAAPGGPTRFRSRREVTSPLPPSLPTSDLGEAGSSPGLPGTLSAASGSCAPCFK